MVSEKTFGSGPAFIDTHDSGLDSVCLFPDGAVELRFGSLNAFWPTETAAEEREAYEVKRHRAILRLSGLTSISGQGVWEPIMSVGDGEVYGADGEHIWWSALLTPRRIQRLGLLFLTGDSLTFHAEEAHLTLENEGEYLKRWSGPFLIDPDS